MMRVEPGTVFIKGLDCNWANGWQHTAIERLRVTMMLCASAALRPPALRTDAGGPWKQGLLAPPRGNAHFSALPARRHAQQTHQGRPPGARQLGSNRPTRVKLRPVPRT